MVHGDSVADADGVKNQRGAAGSINAGFDGIDQFVQMHVPRYDFIKRVGNTDDRTVQFPIRKAICS